MVTGRNRIEQALRQFECAEAALSNGCDTQPRPFRLQYTIQVILEVVGHEGKVADVLGKVCVDIQRRITVTLQDLACVTVDP